MFMIQIPIAQKLKSQIAMMVSKDQKMRQRAERTGVWNKKIDKENNITKIQTR